MDSSTHVTDIVDRWWLGEEFAVHGLDTTAYIQSTGPERNGVPAGWMVGCPSVYAGFLPTPQ